MDSVTVFLGALHQRQKHTAHDKWRRRNKNKALPFGIFKWKISSFGICDISKAVTIVLASHFRTICLLELGGVGRGHTKLLQMHVHPVYACVTALLCSMLVGKMLGFFLLYC